jgi:hypothetical protein
MLATSLFFRTRCEITFISSISQIIDLKGIPLFDDIHANSLLLDQSRFWGWMAEFMTVC